jgi:hypothetical protein
MGLAAWPRGGNPSLVWVWCGAVARRSPRDGEPGRTEQRLCRPTRGEFGRLAVLLLDHGVEMPPMI